MRLRRTHKMALLGFFGAILALPTGLYVLRHTDSSYEHSARRSLAKTLDSISSYTKNPAIAVRQSITIDNELIAASGKLVYDQREEIEIAYRSPKPVRVDIALFNETESKHFRTLVPNHTPRFGGVVFDTFRGYSDRDFDLFSFSVPNHRGWVQIRITSDNATIHLPVFLEGEKTADILFVESTDTMKAYKTIPNHRYYYKNPKSLSGAFTRPTRYPVGYELRHFTSANADCQDHLANADFMWKRALKRGGYLFDIASDDFLKTPDNLRRYRVIIMGAHNEYWTASKLLSIQSYLQKGGSMLLLGGNTAWRRIAEADGYEIIWGNGFVASEFESFITDYLGSYWDMRGYDTYAPFKPTEEGLASKFFGEMPEARLFAVSSDFENCCGKVLGASGHETDKLAETSKGFTVIARGQNPDGGGADIVYKRLKEGGSILNFGSVGLWHRSHDPIIGDIIANFIDGTRNLNSSK